MITSALFRIIRINTDNYVREAFIPVRLLSSEVLMANSASLDIRHLFPMVTGLLNAWSLGAPTPLILECGVRARGWGEVLQSIVMGMFIAESTQMTADMVLVI